jgi:hypothetical protein
MTHLGRNLVISSNRTAAAASTRVTSPGDARRRHHPWAACSAVRPVHEIEGAVRVTMRPVDNGVECASILSR